MHIITDSRIPKEALEKLSQFGNVLPFSSEGITYTEVSGHTDIFFCMVDGRLIAAPNTPKDFLEKLNNVGVSYTFGNSPVGADKINSTHYNAVATENYLIHNTKATDKKILELCKDKKIIHCNQGYTRCSMVALADDAFITSDEGISKTLKANHLEHLLVDAKTILLPGFKNGFVGGTCGIGNNMLFLTGSLQHFPNGEKVRRFADSKGFEIVELYNGPLFDCGSLFFINEKEVEKDYTEIHRACSEVHRE